MQPFDLRPSHACKSPSPCAALHFLLVSRPVVQRRRIEVSSVRPNKGVSLRGYLATMQRDSGSRRGP